MKTLIFAIAIMISASFALADEVRFVSEHNPGTYSAAPVNQFAAPGQDLNAERFGQLQKDLSKAQTTLANLSEKMRDNGHDQRYKRQIQNIKVEMKSLGYNDTGVPAPMPTGGGIYTPRYREPPLSSFTTPGMTAPVAGTPEAAHQDHPQ